MTRGILAIVLLFFSLTAKAVAITPYTAAYSLSAFGMVLGQATRVFTDDPHTGYELKMHTSSDSIFLNLEVDESSQGNTHYEPLRYRYLKKNNKNEVKSIADFNWKTMIATSQYKNETYTLPLVLGTQDKLSYQIAMQQDMMAGKKELTYLVVDDKTIESYQFLVKGHETLATALGNIDTVRIEKASDKSKRSTTFWLAPAYGYMLVKLEHVERGTPITITLKTLSHE